MSGDRFDELLRRVCAVVFLTMAAFAVLAIVVGLWRGALGVWL